VRLTLPRRAGIWPFLVLALAIGTAAFLAPRSDLPLSYHNFADQRPWLGIPNFGAVASNALFFLAGLCGLIFLSRKTSPKQFLDGRERWPYVFFFLGLLLTAFGSTYYHLAPDNARLVWDRLPMTIAFMALVAALIGERVNVTLGLGLLPLLTATGVGSVMAWRLTVLQGAADLRFYAAVQLYAVCALLLALLLPPRYTRGGDLAMVAGLYVLAKISETADRQIFSFGHLVSGHTLKHLAAGSAGFWILGMLLKRQAIPHQGTR
jgi:disulfide bond formation protein DsbB